MSDKLRTAILGCGNRSKAYIGTSGDCSNISLSVLCDTDISRAQYCKDTFDLKSVAVSDSVDSVMSDSEIDAVIISTPDPTHAELACQALEAGKHVLLEKPMAMTVEDCIEIDRLVLKNKLVLNLGFTLRATPFYHRIHELVKSGCIGKIMGIEATEHVGDQHGASYMRRWQRNSRLSGGIIANKCSHDIDILRWLIGAPIVRLASFGGRNFFNAGSVTATHCSSCKTADTCQYRYQGLYVNPTEEMKANPSKYDLDLCVFTSDKDVVDNQVVILEYANSVRASFSVQMFNKISDRTIHITGTKGYIDGQFSKNSIEIYKHDKELEKEDTSKQAVGGHGGGDRFLLQSFIDSALHGKEPMSRSGDGVENTATCIAIEKARREGRMVEINEVGYVSK